MIIARGAEAIIEKREHSILKRRIPKSYRLQSLDEDLRSKRTKREAKILEKLPIPGPKLIKVDKFDLEMEFIDGEKLADALNVNDTKTIAKHLATLHDNNIMHGDPTTSNMIKKEDEIYFIDFGLSFISTRDEDRAVDLHLFKEALEAKHHTIAKRAWNNFIDNYNPKNREQIIERLEKVEERGRNKKK